LITNSILVAYWTSKSATATITYVPGPDTWSEVVCAENTHQYYYNNEADVPRAEKPDF